MIDTCARFDVATALILIQFLCVDAGWQVIDSRRFKDGTPLSSRFEEPNSSMIRPLKMQAIRFCETSNINTPYSV